MSARTWHADVLDVPLGEATGPLRDLLIQLADTYAGGDVDDPRRPCCDHETTLRDWQDSGLWGTP